MKEFLKKVKESTAYEILKDQSAMIIFVATLLGSFVTLSTKINSYLYDLGRFTKFNIPIDLINTESFSFYEIAKIFATTLCYVGGILTVFCIRMLFKSSLEVSKLDYEIFGKKQKNIKNTVYASIICVIMIIVLFVVDSITILISSPQSKTGVLLCSAFFIIFQWLYSGWLVKKAYNKIKEDTIKDDRKENEGTLTKKAEEFTDEEIQNLAKRSIITYKALNYLLVVFPFVALFFFASVLGVTNFISGQNSVDDTKSAFQILVFDESEYVVLDKTGDSYILAKKIACEDKDVLIIDTSEQKIISIEKIDYKLKMFDQVILED